MRGAEYTPANSAVMLILAIGGVNLICLWLIGEYLARTYMQGKNRPIYIAKEIIKNDRYEENNG